MMEVIERLRQALLAGNKPTVQGNRLVERLCGKTELERDTVIVALGQLRETGEIACDNWHRGVPIGRVRVSIHPSRTEAEIRWDTVLTEAGAAEADRRALQDVGGKLVDWTYDDLVRLLRGLEALREDFDKVKGESRYEVSARYLLGSSKLLDALPNLALRAYGIDPAQLAGPPAYIITAGPSVPVCVVLVENPQAMEAALRAKGVDEVAWVSTFGYGLSRSGDEYGQQLAGFVEQGRGLTPLVRQGTPPPIAQLLLHQKLYFWGDLDREGLRIYWRLKSKLSQLRLSALYQPMANMIESTDTHHPYTKHAAKLNQSVWRCSENTVQHLLELCEHQAVDQESLDCQAIQQYAIHPYS